MKLFPALLLPLLLAMSHADAVEPASGTQSEAETEAAMLLDLMKMDQTLQAGMDAVLDAELKQNPKLVPYRHVMADFFAKHMSYASLRGEMVKIYAAEFTATELRAAREFYSTPAGMKFLELTPRLVQLGAEMGSRHIQANLHELQAAIRAEQARLAQLESEAEVLEDIAGEE